MKTTFKLLILYVFIILPVGLLILEPTCAITVKQEKELSKEFMKVILANCELNEELYITEYITKIGNKILGVLPKQPFDYHFYVVNDNLYNAFAAPAGHIFVYSGLIEAMESEDELAGIMAHEIAHVTCRHISQKIERAKKVNVATIAGMIAAAFLGKENPEVAQALSVGSVATGKAVLLSYNRDNERQADKLALEYLKKTGYDGKALMKILYKIKNKNWFDTGQIPSYLKTHPGTTERISYIDSWTAVYGKKKKTKSSKHSDEFKMVQARLIASHSDETMALKKFEAMIKKNKNDPLACYGYGLTLERVGKKKEAIGYLKKSLELKAFSPEVLTALGRIYLYEGDYNRSLRTLKSAISIAPDNQEGLFYLGRAYTELGHYQKAISIYKRLVKANPNYIQTYYHLGKTYGRKGKLADAHFNLGKYYFKKKRYKTAKIQFEKALENTNNVDKKREIKKILKKLNRVGNKGV